MNSDLIDAINIADAMNNQKAKKLLLKIAEMPEDMQGNTLKLVKMMIGSDT